MDADDRIMSCDSGLVYVFEGDVVNGYEVGAGARQLHSLLALLHGHGSYRQDASRSRSFRRVTGTRSNNYELDLDVRHGAQLPSN